MTEELRFDGRVAIVTGAGNGLGRSHALLLAARGAKVVVNDLGGDIHGDGSKSSAAADAVVEQIKAAGGEAVANYDSVEDGEAIVRTALDTFGTVDIVINNAGILRDVSFHKMADADWRIIQDVHLNGTYAVTHAAWPILREKAYGRVIMTTSAAGLYGNFGQANYCSAKLGIVGLANCLAIEGRKYNIHVNTIAPLAGSRLTETVMPQELLDALKPEYVSPLVAWLGHEDCENTGGIFEVGAGYIGKLRWERTVGGRFNTARGLTPDQIAAQWGQVTDFGQTDHPADTNDSFQPVIQVMNNPPQGGNQFVDLDAAYGDELVLESSYDTGDLALYALGIGAAADPLNDSERKYVYELDKHFMAFPTYGVMPQSVAMLAAAKAGKLNLPGMNFGLDRLLHGEQFTELKRPLPAHARLKHTFKLKEAWDKDPHAVLTFAISSTDDDGEEVVYNEMTAFVRGAGGWGGERGPSGEDVNRPPEREPDAVIEEQTHANQTLLYRLSGDWNPLHADPAFAQAMGFDQPILHGLCTFGYCGRHVIQAFADNDGRYFKNIKVRFAKSTYPGDTLVTRMWRESATRIVFETRVKERDEVVIGKAAVELYEEIPAGKPKKKADGETTDAEAPAAAVAEPGGRDVVALLGEYVAEHPELAGQVGKVYQWHVTDPDLDFVLDLKHGEGSVYAGTADFDTSIGIAEQDLMALMRGESDAQTMYFGGKLAIGGDIMASQKLQFLADMDPATVQAELDQAVADAPGGDGAGQQAAAESRPKREPVSPAVFDKLAERLTSDRQAVNGVAGHVIEFRIGEPEAVWTLDCLSDTPKLVQGASPDADAVFGIADKDLEALSKGEAEIRDLYQRGQLRVDGNVLLAREIGFIKGLG